MDDNIRTIPNRLPHPRASGCPSRTCHHRTWMRSLSRFLPGSANYIFTRRCLLRTIRLEVVRGGSEGFGFTDSGLIRIASILPAVCSSTTCADNKLLGLLLQHQILNLMHHVSVHDRDCFSLSGKDIFAQTERHSGMRALWSTEWLYTGQQIPSCKCKPSANMNTIGSANLNISQMKCVP